MRVPRGNGRPRANGRGHGPQDIINPRNHGEDAEGKEAKQSTKQSVRSLGGEEKPLAVLPGRGYILRQSDQTGRSRTFTNTDCISRNETKQSASSGERPLAP